jgi:hypothetical protein
MQKQYKLINIQIKENGYLLEMKVSTVQARRGFSFHLRPIRHPYKRITLDNIRFGSTQIHFMAVLTL